MNAPAMAIFGFVLCLAVARGQDTDDFSNQQRLYELLRQAYFTDYTAQHQQHRLAPAMTAELAEFQQKAMASPALALAVAMGNLGLGKEMDVDSIRDASELMALSIQPCTESHARWPYAVLLFSELGREFASRYLTEQAADTLERSGFLGRLLWVPLAQFLENNFEMLRSELLPLAEDAGRFDELAFENSRVEANSSVD
ncbi:hypothetical protein AK812_SmicGene26061 [Symbiodinium microadriaticum]|uniref:Uncharacterized protein n=1 Tax=Symbiodinium microadriaticum TaxID=2951 RepID=A0A1Q9DAL1_SYMMI|nr:hypothetical protein AK812_SmicGene26061 [Symbiodinium microadriaticum]